MTKTDQGIFNGNIHRHKTCKECRSPLLKTMHWEGYYYLTCSRRMRDGCMYEEMLDDEEKNQLDQQNHNHDRGVASDVAESEVESQFSDYEDSESYEYPESYDCDAEFGLGHEDYSGFEMCPEGFYDYSDDRGFDDAGFDEKHLSNIY